MWEVEITYFAKTNGEAPYLHLHIHLLQYCLEQSNVIIALFSCAQNIRRSVAIGIVGHGTLLLF